MFRFNTEKVSNLMVKKESDTFEFDGGDEDKGEF